MNPLKSWHFKPDITLWAVRWYWRNPSDLYQWHIDETYVNVNGRWAYLYRAVDSRGHTVDFYLSARRNSKAAYQLLGEIFNNVKNWQIPRFINRDKAPTYGCALALLKRKGWALAFYYGDLLGERRLVSRVSEM